MPSKISNLIILATASIAMTFGVAACNKSNVQDTSAQAQPAQRITGPYRRNPSEWRKLSATARNPGTATELSAAGARAADFFSSACSRPPGPELFR